MSGPNGEGGLAGTHPVVIDTNIVLDLFLFDDDAARPLRQALEGSSVEWLATLAMRVELERVLGYPQIVPRLVFYGLAAADVLAQFDRYARIVEAAPRAPFVCKDADDQIFIDLAVAHRSSLVSKDRAVLAMARRLRALDVAVEKSLVLAPVSAVTRPSRR